MTRQSREIKQEARRSQCRKAVITLTVTGLRLTYSDPDRAALYFLAADVAAAMAGAQ